MVKAVLDILYQKDWNEIENSRDDLCSCNLMVLVSINENCYYIAIHVSAKEFCNFKISQCPPQ